MIEEELNCGLLAIKDALLILKIKITYEELRNHYFNLGFKIHDFGISSIHVALLASTFNFATNLKTTSAWLKEIYEVNNKFKSEINLSDDCKDTLKALRLLINLGGKISFPKGRERIKVDDIICAINHGSVVIVCVNARQYYGINEKWNHYIIAHSKKNCESGFAVIDSLENLGKGFYPEWNKYIKNAKRFNWSKWSGDMIEIKGQ